MSKNSGRGKRHRRASNALNCKHQSRIYMRDVYAYISQKNRTLFLCADCNVYFREDERGRISSVWEPKKHGFPGKGKPSRRK